MSPPNTTQQPGIGDRIRRSQGRFARNAIASAKVTKDELRRLEAAAKGDGKSLSEWAREVLLDRARQGSAQGAVFTELMALRLLMNGVLRSLVIGKPLTEAQYQNLLTEVKRTKHETARDVLAQYQPNQPEE